MSQARDDAATRHTAPRSVGYSFARAEMQEADLLLWRGQYGISKVFEWLTASFYSHAAIAAHWEGELMLLQAEAAGIQAVPLHVTVAKYPGQVDWYRLRPPYENRLDRARTLHAARRCLGWQFGYLEVLRAIGYRVLGIGNPYDSEHPRALYCSEYVATCFRAGGIVFGPNPDADTFPQDISDSPVVEYLGTIHADPGMPSVGAVPALPLGRPAGVAERGEDVADPGQPVDGDAPGARG